MFISLVAMLLSVAPEPAAAGERWEILATEPVFIRVRAVPGSNAQEVWAEGEIAAPAQDIQSALMDSDRLPEFMPFVKESRRIGQPLPDGSQYVYTRLDFGPWIKSRDYVLRVHLERSVAIDGTGEFRNRWVAEPDRLPSRANAIRLRVNQGSWRVVSRGPNRSFAINRFLVDPGGWVPAFAANAGNKQGVTDTYKAVEREAQRRAAARRRANESAWR